MYIEYVLTAFMQGAAVHRAKRPNRQITHVIFSNEDSVFNTEA
jgi:hypothetical protein